MNNIENGIERLDADTSTLKDDLTAAQVELAKKANTDGYYEEMTVGNAEQLVSTVTNADDTPYNFRTTAGSVDVGDRAYVDAIVGGTLNVNQLVQNGNFADVSVWSTYSSNYTVSNNVATIEHLDANGFIYQPITSVSAHKYLISVDVRSDTITSGFLYWNSMSFRNNAITPTWGNIATVFNSTGSGTNLSFRFNTNGESATGQLRNFMLTDLTATFDTTIADYIYSLETATAGAGVAWLKANAPKIFDGGYIPFNAGTLQSVVGLSEKRNTGLNQWDEETEIGDIDGITGAFKTGNYLRTKNHIPVLPNTTYYFDIPSAVYFYEYDANKDVIMNGNYAYHYKSTSGTVTTGANTHYITFRNDISNASQTYHYDICVNLHWDGEKDGTYEPYTVHTYAFDPTVELRGVPKLKDGKMYFDGDRYLPDGTVNRRYGVVDLGTLNWMVYSAERSIYRADISDGKTYANNNVIPSLLSAKYTTVSGDATWANGMVSMYLTTLAARIVICDTNYSTSESFKAAMSGVMLVYELATPTTETAEPYNPVEIVDDFGTEEFITTSLVPVGHETRYAPNLRAKLEMSPDSPDGDGLYIVQQSSGENTYIPLASSATIQNILARLTALEGNTNEG